MRQIKVVQTGRWNDEKLLVPPLNFGMVTSGIYRSGSVAPACAHAILPPPPSICGVLVPNWRTGRIPPLPPGDGRAATLCVGCWLACVAVGFEQSATVLQW